MHLRPYQPADAPQLAAVYRDAVLKTGTTAYTPEQVAVWAAFADDLPRFTSYLNRGSTIVGLDDGQIVSFGNLDPVDHLSLLYTRSDYNRHGYATAIYRQLEVVARTADATFLRTNASHISREFFLKLGFKVICSEQVGRRGVEFERFLMAKQLVEHP